MSLRELAADYVKHGLAIVPIPRGRKGPVEKGWNRRENVITTLEGVDRLNGGNVGLAHAYSRTVAVDVDDYIQARESLQAHGIDLDALLATEGAVQISSGRPNRCKLIFRLPYGVDPLLTVQPSGYELRCMAENGLTVQDVLPPSIHPDTGKPYEWRGDWRRIPELPPDLLALWRKLTTGARSKGPSLGIDHDPLLQALDARGMVRADKGGGKWDVICPWSTEHTTGDDTAAYFEPHTGGYAGGAFRCLHAHCQGRTLSDVRAFLGLQAARDGFTDSGGPAPNGFDHMSDEDMPGESHKRKSPGQDTPSEADVFLGPEGARFSFDELTGDPFEPNVVVDRYLLSDAGGLVSPGGYGKTTLSIYESVHIILGKSLYERRIESPGSVVFVTAEDTRQIVGSVLNRVMTAMGLDEAEKRLVHDGFYVEDLSAQSARLVGTANGEIIITCLVDDLIEKYKDSNIAYCHLDPTSNLGPGESAGNDGMSEVMRAGRRISQGLGCAVRWIHHVPKAVAREKIADQYAGRGGSAFADNARFIHQLAVMNTRTLKFEEQEFILPRQISDEQVAAGAVLALLIHKISYQQRDRVPIFLVRDGFTFRHYIPQQAAKEAEFSEASRKERVIRVCKLIEKRAQEGIRMTPRALDECSRELEMTRQQVRTAVHEGLQQGYMTERDLPPNEVKGARKTYLASLYGPDTSQSGTRA